MKLYEFTYTDNQNLSESEILKRMEVILNSEAEIQGWKNGFNLIQSKEFFRQSDNGRQFSFEVHDKFSELN